MLGSTPALLAKVSVVINNSIFIWKHFARCSATYGCSLTADIIRLSNSPFYAPAVRNSNLLSAVNQIGLREVVRVVNLSLSRQLFARDLGSYGITAREYWSAPRSRRRWRDGGPGQLAGLDLTGCLYHRHPARHRARPDQPDH